MLGLPFLFQSQRVNMATKSTKESASKKSNAVKDAPIAAGTLPFALGRLERLIGGSAASIITVSPGAQGKTLVSAQAQGAVAEVQIPELSGLDKPWSFGFDALQPALLNHNNAKITFSDGEMRIQDKSYNAVLQGQEAATVVRVEKPEEITCDISVTNDLWNALEQMTQKVKIAKSLAAAPDITVHFAFGKKTALVAAFDGHQMASYSIPNEFGTQFSLTLPLPKAEALFKSGSGATHVKANADLMYVKAGNVVYSSALPSTEDLIPIDVVIGKLKELKDTKFGKKVEIKKTDLQKFLENSRAVSNANALLKFTVTEGQALLKISAEGNSVSAKVAAKAKKAFQFQLDIAYVNTIVGKSDDVITLEMEQNMLAFRTEQLLYVSVLSQDDSSDAPKKKKRSDEDEE